MKSVFDPSTRSELINRIDSLSDNSVAKWGKMSIYQMLKHCSLWDDMGLGRTKIKRMLPGYLFGRLALKAVLKDESPLGRNTPTSPAFVVSKKTGSVLQQKKEWISRINAYAGFNNAGFIHPFFGRMKDEQIGQMAYKHADHHLRQFGA